jgi:nucleoside-diphosphate-sugar epimerase
MNVFITGATGYIGFQIAQAFSRAGYSVWGLTRDSFKAAQLSRHEIFPVIGDLTRPETFVDIARNTPIFIHAALDPEGSTAQVDQQAVETLLKVAHDSDHEKTFVYTSGLWIYGSQKEHLDEKTLFSPIPMDEWRPGAEAKIVQAENIRSLILRPATVYGKQGGLFSKWFHEAHVNKSLNVIGDGRNHWPLVHVDDLAQAFLLAVESNLRDQSFNIADPSEYTMIEIISAIGRVTNYDGALHKIDPIDAKRLWGEVVEGYLLDHRVNSGKAQRLLGWFPRHKSFIDQIETYFLAWQAFQSEKEWVAEQTRGIR